nr:helix-turn-helix domain-containing protein [Vagococcus elongatus]
MNETKKYKVIKAVAEKKKQKARACIELNLSIRQVNRLVKAYKEKGKIIFAHKNRGVKHKHAVPDNIKQQIITIYRQFKVRPNVKHFERYSEEFDTIPETKKERRKYIPPQSHPWKLESFKRYLRRIESTLEDYEAEKTA